MIPDGQCLLINYCPTINHVYTFYMTTRYFEIVKSTQRYLIRIHTKIKLN